ncbi:PREDICTED: reticulon-4 receptor-like 2 [Branchiostoma belcheri]|uniref:Reticulon-4 receptor-like 2 n=1 Tax=Branchiostoma belcheri TaxID=7741 RepID=A0A6P4Z0J6_BRABE|nr:PREDICTED: reticulon-4 receptor-like 2 [Branchiostoma belcheri]
MTNKVRTLLVLLLIILKETGPTKACSSSCSSDCDCSRRGLTSVPQDLPTAITTLNLHWNAITTIEQYDFFPYRSLERLNLGQNQISMIHVRAFHNLTSLNEINLSQNQLTSLSADIFEGLGNLQSLYLSSNQLTSLSADIFEGLGNLQTLNLYDNQLTILSADIFEGLGNLQTLDLYYNQLTNLPADIFQGLGNLTTLTLNSNQLTSLSADIFSGLGNLQTLDLSFSRLTSLSADIFDILASIQYVDIYDNRWQCDCRMLPFKQKMNGSYAFENQIICAGPGNLSRKSLLREVNPEDLICEQTSTVSFSTDPSTVAEVSTPTSSTKLTAHIAVTSPDLSAVSTSSPLSSTVKSTPQAPMSSPTSSITNIPDTSGLSTASPFGQTVKSTSQTPVYSTLPISSISRSTELSMTESNAAPSSEFFSLPVFLSGFLGVVAGIFLLGIVLFARYMYKRRNSNPLADQSPGVVFSNTNTATATVTISAQNQTRHGTSQTDDSAEYDDVAIQSGSSQVCTGHRQDRYSVEGGYEVPPPSLPPRNGAGQQVYYQNESD